MFHVEHFDPATVAHAPLVAEDDPELTSIPPTITIAGL